MRQVVIDLKVRRNLPQSSNVALNVRTNQNLVARAAPGTEDASERMEIRHTSFLLKNGLLL